ncbi:hypothetical protein YPPY60_3023, partial [Yersinia pestis PY-60]
MIQYLRLPRVDKKMR